LCPTSSPIPQPLLDQTPNRLGAADRFLELRNVRVECCELIGCEADGNGR
jgi:hypothetical protein